MRDSWRRGTSPARFGWSCARLVTIATAGHSTRRGLIRPSVSTAAEIGAPPSPKPSCSIPSPRDFTAGLPRGKEIYVYNDGEARVRKALRYKIKRPGDGWGPERTFFDAGIHNSYPTLLEYAPDEFYAVWDSGTEKARRTSIRFGKLILK